MKLSFVSSTALATSLRQTISQTQTRLITASTEATTGTYADLGESLGSGTATSIDLRTAIDQAASLKANNSVTSVRLDASQTTLSSLQDVADSLVSNLTALQGSQDPTSLTIAQQSASDTISQLISSANTMVNGEYIFAGINVDVAPLSDQSAAMTSAISSALADYASGLGKSVNELTGDEMTTFISDTVEPMFSEAAWTDSTSGWSSASSTNMTSRISTSETVTSSTNANSEGMRYLALAATVISAIGSQDISADALSAVTSSAISYASQASSALVTQQSVLGLSQERVEKANDALDAQSSLLTTRLTELQGVDTYEASTLINTLQTQLETAYTLVSKLQSLSLVDYL